MLGFSCCAGAVAAQKIGLVQGKLRSYRRWGLFCESFTLVLLSMAQVVLPLGSGGGWRSSIKYQMRFLRRGPYMNMQEQCCRLPISLCDPQQPQQFPLPDCAFGLKALPLSWLPRIEPFMQLQMG